MMVDLAEDCAFCSHPPQRHAWSFLSLGHLLGLRVVLVQWNLSSVPGNLVLRKKVLVTSKITVVLLYFFPLAVCRLRITRMPFPSFYSVSVIEMKCFVIFNGIED